MIAIKDFKMPENCLICPMQFGGWCYVSPPEVDERVAPTVDEAWEQGKPDWCPLVEVPNEAGNCSEIPNNSDCVSRQDAVEVADAIWTVTGDKNVAKVWQQLKDLPSVQPEIIRCKDCKFFIDHRCYYWRTLDDWRGTGDFCSYAERKEDV